MFLHAKYFAVALCLFCLPIQLVGQDRCRERTVLVNVTDAHGVPMQGLTASDFVASYRSRTVNILDVRYTETPRRVVMLLDVSGSMLGKDVPNKWNTARAAAVEFLTSADYKTQISFMTFAKETGIQIDASAGRKAISDWLGSGAAADPRALSGTTALFDAVRQALKQLQPGDAIYVITDGGNDSGSDSVREVSRKLQDAGVRLFALLLDDSFRTMEEQSAYESFLRLVITAGGFVEALAPVQADWSVTNVVGHGPAFARLRAATTAIDAQITGVYSATLEFPENSSKQESWKLELVDAGGRNRKGVTVAYPHDLFPCSTRP